MKTNKRMGVVLSDVHCPFEDKSVCRMALAFIREHRPATVHLLGDIADFYSVSRFTKDPSVKRITADLTLRVTFWPRCVMRRRRLGSFIARATTSSACDDTWPAKPRHWPCCVIYGWNAYSISSRCGSVSNRKIGRTVWARCCLPMASLSASGRPPRHVGILRSTAVV